MKIIRLNLKEKKIIKSKEINQIGLLIIIISKIKKVKLNQNQSLKK